jgi:hypothetical protein
MLQKSPEKRISLKEVCSSKWFMSHYLAISHLKDTENNSKPSSEKNILSPPSRLLKSPKRSIFNIGSSKDLNQKSNEEKNQYLSNSNNTLSKNERNISLSPKMSNQLSSNFNAFDVVEQNSQCSILGKPKIQSSMYLGVYNSIHFFFSNYDFSR